MRHWPESLRVIAGKHFGYGLFTCLRFLRPDTTERYGKDVVTLALGLGVTPRNGQSSTQALQTVVLHQSEAADNAAMPHVRRAP